LFKLIASLDPNAICKSKAYLLVTKAEKNEGRQEKASGRAASTVAVDSHSKKIASPARDKR
jgi:hypothetical protein